MNSHFRTYGFLYILFILFAGSWVGQAVTQGTLGSEFWASTFENWQSEFLQLLIQALGMYVIVDWIFRKANENAERVERKVDAMLLLMQGVNSIISGTDDKTVLVVEDLPEVEEPNGDHQ